MEGIKTHSMTISTHRMSWKLQIGSNIIIYVNEGQYICLYEHTAVSALNIASASESMTNVNVTINKHRMWCIAISGHGIDSTRLTRKDGEEERELKLFCLVVDSENVVVSLTWCRFPAALETWSFGKCHSHAGTWRLSFLRSSCSTPSTSESWKFAFWNSTFTHTSFYFRAAA